jgi:hypothetical protein
MAISVKKIVVWSREIGNQPGTLGAALGPFADARCDLQVCMAYEKPGESGRSIAEIAPVAGMKATRAAEAAGFTPSSIPCLVIDGDNQPGLGRATATALGAAGINIQFLVTLVAGKKYRSIFGFPAGADVEQAQKVIRSAAAAMRPTRAARRPARRGARKAARKK